MLSPAFLHFTNVRTLEGHSSYPCKRVCVNLSFFPPQFPNIPGNYYTYVANAYSGISYHVDLRRKHTYHSLTSSGKENSESGIQYEINARGSCTFRIQRILAIQGISNVVNGTLYPIENSTKGVFLAI